MISAFGVDDGLVSKEDTRKVPDWASGAMPASSAKAFSNSRKHKTDAGVRNFGWTTGGTAAGTAVGATLVGLAFRKAKPYKHMPKFFYKETPVRNPFKGTGRTHLQNPHGPGGTVITSGEKQRYLGMTLGGTLGTAGGAAAGAYHLNQVKKNPRYRYKEEK